MKGYSSTLISLKFSHNFFTSVYSQAHQVYYMIRFSYKIKMNIICDVTKYDNHTWHLIEINFDCNFSILLLIIATVTMHEIFNLWSLPITSLSYEYNPLLHNSWSWRIQLASLFLKDLPPPPPLLRLDYFFMSFIITKNYFILKRDTLFNLKEYLTLLFYVLFWN